MFAYFCSAERNREVATRRISLIYNIFRPRLDGGSLINYLNSFVKGRLPSRAAE